MKVNVSLILNRAGIAFGVLSIALSQALLGMYSGYGYASRLVCEYNYPTFGQEGNTWTIFHADPLFDLSGFLSYLSIAIFVFVLLKLFERGWIYSITLLLPLFASAYLWWSANTLISAYVGFADKYLDILRETRTGFLILAFSILITLILQIVSLGLGLAHRNKADSTDPRS